MPRDIIYIIQPFKMYLYSKKSCYFLKVFIYFSGEQKYILRTLRSGCVSWSFLFSHFLGKMELEFGRGNESRCGGWVMINKLAEGKGNCSNVLCAWWFDQMDQWREAGIHLSQTITGVGRTVISSWATFGWPPNGWKSSSFKGLWADA